MSKYLIILQLLTGPFLRGQVNIGGTSRPIYLSNKVLLDSTRTDWSFLDRIWLISKCISPASSVESRHDTLVVGFELPQQINDDSLKKNYLTYYSQCYYDALSTVFTRDSMTYNRVGIYLCIDSASCAESFYDMKRHVYRNFTPEEQVELFLKASMWTTERSEFTGYNKKKTIVIYSFIDTSLEFSKAPYIQSFCYSVAGVIGDFMHKRHAKPRYPYEDIVMLFCSGATLKYYWRIPLNKKQYERWYQYKYHETATKYQKHITAGGKESF